MRNIDPTSHAGNRKLRNSTRALAAVAALSVAACSPSHSSDKESLKPTRKSVVVSTTPSTTPETTTTTSPEQSANAYNKEVANEVQASISKRLATLPEKIIAYGKSHGMSHHIYETGVPGINTGVDNSTDLNRLVQGTDKNILAQSRGAGNPGDAEIRFSFNMSYSFNPDGSRKLGHLSFFDFDNTDETTFDDDELRGFNSGNSISIILDPEGVLHLGYTDAQTGVKAEEGAIEQTGDKTSIKPAEVENLLNYFETELTKG